MSKNKKFLIINIFGIGDVLFTTPMIRSIKNAYPDAAIGYICNQRAFPVLEHHPDINHFHIYERDFFRQVGRLSRRDLIKAYFRFIREIRSQHYDTVFDLSLSTFMNWVTVLAGIRRRVGYHYKNRSPFLTMSVRLKGYEGKHVVEYYLDLVARAGIPVSSQRLEVSIPDADRQWVQRLIKEIDFKSMAYLICLVPGGGASWGKDAGYKRWPPQRWAELADKMIEELGANVILLGSEDEISIGREICAAMKRQPLDMIGRLNLGQYLAFMTHCQLAVVHDGGPLHMAVAAGVPTVSIFGGVDEKVYGPYPATGHAVVTHAVSCRPCYREFRRPPCEHIRCLNEMSVAEVFEPVQRHVAATKQNPITRMIK